MGRENFPKRKKSILEIQKELDQTRRVYDIASLAGKTIAKGVEDYEMTFLIFTDRTFITLQAEGERHIFTDQTLNEHDYLKLGLITEKDFKKIKAAEEAEMKARRRAAYEHLRKEFEEEK